MPRSLSRFKALSFDCYGTLVDWENGVHKQLQPLLNRLPADHPFRDQDTVIGRFGVLQTNLEREQPRTLYNDVWAICYTQIAEEGGLTIAAEEAVAFGKNVGSWDAFSDTVAGLRTLKKHYKLIILSNVDRESVSATLKGPRAGVEFDAVLTAQDIGSYKPDHRNFEALFDALDQQFGLNKDDWLHVAKSLPVDYVPAKQLGLASAWIARGNAGASAMGGRLEDFKDAVSFTWRFASVDEMADAVEAHFADGA